MLGGAFRLISFKERLYMGGMH